MVKEFPAKKYRYNILRVCGGNPRVYPLLRDDNGICKMTSIGPLHGRSFVVGREGERYVLSKGNGLGYTQFDFLFSGELSGMGDDTLGLLLKQDALRDLSEIKEQVERWEELNYRHFQQKHLIAADVMVKNLRLMHDNGILHNAIHEQNYTWALELLDFELGRSPQHPYEKSDYERHVESLLHREAFQTYVIINYIAWVLKEDIDYSVIDGIFADYGYDLSQYGVSINKNLL